MTAIAEHLDRRLKTLPPAAAASVEKLVWDVLSVVDAEPPALDHEAAVKAHREHIAKCLDMASELDWSDFERPDQGVEEIREDW
ncbi:MAG: hypothetical protein ACOYMN_12965 [Roseimicrobium sp.]